MIDIQLRRLQKKMLKVASRHISTLAEELIKIADYEDAHICINELLYINFYNIAVYDQDLIPSRANVHYSVGTEGEPYWLCEHSVIVGLLYNVYKRDGYIEANFINLY